MTYELIRIQFEDQAPAIGSGSRAVLVVHQGPKWVRVLDPASCESAQMPRQSGFDGKRRVLGWDDLARNGRSEEYDRARMARLLRRNAKLYDRMSATVRDAIETLQRTTTP